jgi:hypothetical protein
VRQAISYYKRFFWQAWVDCLRWGWQQVIGVLLAFAILVLQIHSGVIQKELAAGNFESIALPYAVLLAFVVLLAIVSAPVKLDAARENESLGLRKQVAALTPPKRTPEQEQKYAIASAALGNFGPKAIIVLRHLANHGSLKFNGIIPPLPRDMSPQETRTILDACCEAQLVTRIEQPRTVPGVPGYFADYVYTIALGMKTTLDELLY